MNKSLFTRVLGGSRRVQVSEVGTLAVALQTTPQTILEHLGYPAHAVRPAGRVLPDGRVSPIVDRRHALPPLGDYPAEASALLITAAEGPLAWADGGALVYLPAAGVAAATVGRLCVLEDAEAPLPVLGVLQPASGRLGVAALVFGSNERVALATLVRASPVLGLHLPR